MTKEEFMALVEPIADLIGKKGEDYNEGSVTIDQYMPFKHRSYVHMIFLKALRAVSLVNKSTEPNFESIDDTVKDLIAYAVFYLGYLADPEGFDRRKK